MNLIETAKRAEQLTCSMSHGEACHAAVRETDTPEEDIARLASLVSTALTMAEINGWEVVERELGEKARP